MVKKKSKIEETVESNTFKLDMVLSKLKKQSNQINEFNDLPDRIDNVNDKIIDIGDRLDIRSIIHVIAFFLLLVLICWNFIIDYSHYVGPQVPQETKGSQTDIPNGDMADSICEDLGYEWGYVGGIWHCDGMLVCVIHTPRDSIHDCVTYDGEDPSKLKVDELSLDDTNMQELPKETVDLDISPVDNVSFGRLVTVMTDYICKCSNNGTETLLKWCLEKEGWDNLENDSLANDYLLYDCDW